MMFPIAPPKTQPNVMMSIRWRGHALRAMNTPSKTTANTPVMPKNTARNFSGRSAIKLHAAPGLRAY